MRLQIEGKLLLGSLSIAVIITALVVVGVVSTRRLVTDADQVSLTQELRLSLREFARRTEAAESDARGFLLTEDSSYLASHRANVAAARAAFERASTLAASDSAERARIAAAEDLVAAADAAFDSTTRLGTNRHVDRATVLARLAVNESVTDEIDRLIDTANASAERLLAVRQRRQAASEVMVTTTSIAAVLTLVTLAIALARSITRELAARQRREAHEHALAVASGLLAQTTAFDETVQTVAQLPVPLFGDWAVLHMVEETEAGIVLRPVPSGTADGSRAETLAALTTEAIDLNSADAVVDVVRTRQVRVIEPVTTDWIESHAENVRRAELMSNLGMHQLVFAPLLARQRLFGVWAIGASNARHFGDHEKSLLTDLSNRAALALESADALRRAQRASAARDNVLSVVSHDLRNPLSAISMLSRRLVEDELSSDERRAVGSQILTSADWMHRLMQDLLDLSSIEAGKLSVDIEPQLVPDMVGATMTMFTAGAAAKGVTLHCTVPQDLPPVAVDSERIIQVLANLVANALKFTPRGGVVSVGAQLDGQGVRLSVEDTGPGIAPTDLSHVFDRFWHGKRNGSARGTGLGLAIVQGIVKAHGGQVSVESTVGRGSAFTFTIPVASRRPGLV